MPNNDTHRLHDNGISIRLDLVEGRYDHIRFMRVPENRHTIVTGDTPFATASFAVDDDLLDAFIEVAIRVRDQRDQDLGRGHAVVESLRGTEDGLAIADALDRGRAA